MTPCVSTPRRFAQTRTSATTAASALGMPARAKASAAKHLSASAEAVGAAWCNCVLLIPGSDPRGKIFGEPIAQEVDHQRIPFREHEMVDIGDEMEIGRLARALKALDRLPGQWHRGARRMQQTERPRPDPPDDGADGELVPRG